MKRQVLSRCPAGFTSLVITALVAACSGPTTPETTEYFTGDRGVGGELEVTFADDAKALLGPSLTQASDDFQLVAFAGSTVTSRVLKAGVANVLSLAPGSWRIIALAGLKRSTTSSTVFLVGAASQDNVVITHGARTSLTLTLRSLDTTFEVLGTTTWNDTVTVRAAGKSRNPTVGMYLAETSADRHPRFRSLELWGGYKDATVTGNPTDWSAEVTGKVPEGGTEVAVWLIGPQLCLLDGTGAWVPATGLLEGSWEWLNRADMADTHPLAGEAERHVATLPPATGLNLTLGWE